MSIYVVVASSAEARIFSAKNAIAGLQEVLYLQHPEARLHLGDFFSDRAGRTQDSNIPARHAYSSSIDPKTHEQIVFAKEVAGHIETARQRNEFERLLIVADPTFLGLLRQHLEQVTQRLISQEISKNLVALDAGAIRQHLPERI